jgi:dipeptidyl aminopeptidase/acylaminoacyl peptidase
MPTAPPDDPYGLTDYVVLFHIIMGWEIPSVYYLSPAGNLMPVPLPDEGSMVWGTSPLYGRWMLFGRTAPEKQGYVYVGGVLLDLEDGSRRSFEPATGCAMGWPTLSSDGRYLAFRQHNYGVDGTGPCDHIRLYDLETGHVRTVLEGEDLYSPVFWSSVTGRFYFQLVARGSDRPRAGLWSLTPQGTGWEELPDIGDLWRLSPDGAMIAYLAFDRTVADYRSYYGNEMRGATNELHLLDLRTGETRLLSKEEEGAEYLTAGLDWLSEDVLVVERVELSADGDTFIRREILLLDVDEGSVRPLLQEQDVPTEVLGISPSPNGRWLMVISWCREGNKGWLLDAETGERRNLLVEKWPLHPPVWCDHGERLAYSLEDNIVRVDAETLTMTVLWQGEAVHRGVVSACR